MNANRYGDLWNTIYNLNCGDGYDAQERADEAAEDIMVLVQHIKDEAAVAALREARDNYRPGDNNPWALNVRKFLDYRANMIEGGE